MELLRRPIPTLNPAVVHSCSKRCVIAGLQLMIRKNKALFSLNYDNERRNANEILSVSVYDFFKWNY